MTRPTADEAKTKGRMIGLWFKQFRERLGADRAKVLIDVGKALATVSFIGAGTVLGTSLFSAIVLIVGGFIFLALALILSEPPR
jgi:hypothetical protein